MARGGADFDVSEIFFQDFRFNVFLKLILPNYKHSDAGGRFSGSLWLLFSGITYYIVGAQLETVRRSVKPSADNKTHTIGS